MLPELLLLVPASFDEFEKLRVRDLVSADPEGLNRNVLPIDLDGRAGHPDIVSRFLSGCGIERHVDSRHDIHRPG